MTVRHARAPGPAWAVEALRRLNARHPWSHNDHFHDWITTRLPETRDSALDVGCGRGGLLRRLAPYFQRVVGADADREMARVAAEACADLPRVTVLPAAADQVRGRYDLVTMVAVLHHLGTEECLRRGRSLLAPGGRLIVVGLARVETFPDRLWDVGCALSNPLVGLASHPQADRTPPGPPPFPVADPEATYDEIRAIANRIVPGHRMRRRIGFRYTLEWTRPTR